MPQKNKIRTLILVTLIVCQSSNSQDISLKTVNVNLMVALSRIHPLRDLNVCTVQHLSLILQVYDPSAAYLGPPVFYAPQAYAAIPGQFRFPAAKAHVGGRGLIRTPSVRGEDRRTLLTS